MPEKTSPQVVFLGFAERSEQFRDAETVCLKWTVLGLKNVVLVNFLPSRLHKFTQFESARGTSSKVH
jgi:hypothetical protein